MIFQAHLTSSQLLSRNQPFLQKALVTFSWKIVLRNQGLGTKRAHCLQALSADRLRHTHPMLCLYQKGEVHNTPSPNSAQRIHSSLPTETWLSWFIMCLHIWSILKYRESRFRVVNLCHRVKETYLPESSMCLHSFCLSPAGTQSLYHVQKWLRLVLICPAPFSMTMLFIGNTVTVLFVFQFPHPRCFGGTQRKHEHGSESQIVQKR